MPPHPTSPAKLFALVGLAIALTVGHVYYYWAVGYALFAARGGVQQHGRWTSLGGIDYAWTTPVYVPGGALMALSPAESNGCPNASPLAMLLLLGGSVAAGWALASVLLAGLCRDRRLLGRWAWRLWLAAAGWGWVLVPVKWSWVYWWTVAY